MQFVVIVVLAVIYGLGSIIKAKARKTEQQGGEEELTRKPTRRLPGVSESLQEKLSRLGRPTGPIPRKPYGPAVQPPRKKIVRPQPAVPQRQPDFQELPEFTSEAVKKLGHKRVSVPAETPQAKHLSNILLDYADADSLRRAILHYEILGKPISMLFGAPMLGWTCPEVMVEFMYYYEGVKENTTVSNIYGPLFWKINTKSAS